MVSHRGLLLVGTLIWLQVRLYGSDGHALYRYQTHSVQSPYLASESLKVTWCTPSIRQFRSGLASRL